MSTKEELQKLTNKELDAQVALYLEGGVDFELPKFNNKDERVAFLAELQEQHGIAHKVTAEDIDNNKDMPADIKVDDIVLLPVTDDLTDEEKAEVENKQAELEGQADEKPKPVVTPKADDTDEEVKPTTNLFHRNRPVIEVNNRLVNGKIYKEVVLNDSTELLSVEEFETQVTSK